MYPLLHAPTQKAADTVSSVHAFQIFLTNLIACIVFYGFAHILKGLALDL